MKTRMKIMVTKRFPRRFPKRVPVGRRGLITVWVFLLIPAFSSAAAEGGAIVKLAEVEFTGKVYKDDDISAVESLPGQLIIGSDEGTAIQILDEERPGHAYRVRGERTTLIPGRKEIDIEGMALSKEFLYVIGSHSVKRKKLSPSKSYSRNRERLAETVREPSRENLFRIDLSRISDGSKPDLESISLNPILTGDRILGRFADIPGKENGIDIEGLAVAGDDTLFLGFRSPVLRGNYVPVMVMTYDEPEHYRLRFIDLKGKGIRSLTRVSDGFLLIAGPAGDSEGSFELYYWDGTDGIPGKDKDAASLALLGTIPCPKDGKAEGMTVLEEGADHYKALIVFDGVKSGKPALYRIRKPGVSPRVDISPRVTRPPRAQPGSE